MMSKIIIGSAKGKELLEASLVALKVALLMICSPFLSTPSIVHNEPILKSPTFQPTKLQRRNMTT